MKTLLKILLIGILTTAFRIIGQLIIPPGTQSILLPSIFVSNGTMQIAFTIYGIFAYSLIAALFLLIRNKMSGNKIMQGIKFGISCCVIWGAYLLEPLPHAAPIDRITYPLVDGAALLVMGLLLGVLLGRKSNYSKADHKIINFVLPVAAITVLFVAGRLIQYFLFDIYSSFQTKTAETVLWGIGTGFAVACSLAWLSQYIAYKSKFQQACLLGLVLFGVDLTLFNFFIPLVFNFDVLDLIIRTVIDILFVSLGCLFFMEIKPRPERLRA